MQVKQKQLRNMWTVFFTKIVLETFIVHSVKLLIHNGIRALNVIGRNILSLHEAVKFSK